jgi:predicted ATPase/class 3 adenylate cyclase
MQIGSGRSLPTGTVTFLFTDIEGSTKLAQEHRHRWEALRARHHAILQSAIDAHHGYVFQIIGDAFCVSFHTAEEALRAAVKTQVDLHSEKWGDAPIKVRMGIHTGQAQIQEAGDYHGYLSMSRVQRLMSAAHGGQVLLSLAAQELVRDDLPANVSLRDLGERRLKDLIRPEHVYQLVIPSLPVDFPPIKTLDAYRHNLPTQLTSFIGREKEIEETRQAILDHRLVTLTGVGGTGKTRLSLQVAAEVLDQYPDGAWLVELAPILDPLYVPRKTAIAIGLRDEPHRPVIDMLCDYLREKKMLIILDNCEHLVDACAQMADRLLHASTHTRILASSREALDIAGEATYRVPSLGLPDMSHLPSVESLSQYEAVKLFIDRATSAVSTFAVTNDNTPFLAQICHRLDGIPLAIELAAAKIRVLSLEQIARRLDDRFRLLIGGSRTALERHQTLRAAIDWSYNLLPPVEQILFRQLAIFVGGWTLEAAESICSDESTSSEIKSNDILNLMEQLINKSLVIREETQSESRYRMLETMRQYANEKLVESGKSDALRDHHLYYFLNLAETAAPHLIRPEQLEWLAQLDADYENLRAALEWALNKEIAEPSLRLCAGLGRYWYLRTFWLEGSKWMKSTLSKTAHNPTRAEKIARAQALYQDAELADQLDDLERMKTSAEQSLALAQEVSDNRELAIARFEVANALYRRGDYEHALPLLEQSYVEFQALNDQYWQVNSYRWIIEILSSQGKLKFLEKMKRMKDLLELARNGGERLNIANVLNEFSERLYSQNRLDEALRYAKEADRLFEQISPNINPTSFLFAELAWLKGDYEEAKRRYIEMRERYGLIGEKNLRSAMIASLGRLAMEQGNIDQAQAYFEEALATAREINSAAFIARSLAELGTTFYLQGNIEKCKQSFGMIRGLTTSHERYVLLLTVNYIDISKREIIANILGALDHAQSERPIAPLNMRYYNHAETQTRKELGAPAFESAFAEGQKMSLDDALELALKMVEEL